MEVTRVGDISHTTCSAPGVFLIPQPNSFCREAEMIEQKKKCWREKVTAEITLTHVQEIAHEVGVGLSTAEIGQFLNQNGFAQGVWTHMMQAGEEYIKASLQLRVADLPAEQRPVLRPAMVQ